jgi:YbbR domain-containing protein
MRPRSQTIGTLGRAPARVSRPPEPARSPVDPPPERGAVRRWLRSALLDNLGLKFLSMVLAVTVFLLVNTDKDREMTIPVGVSYTLPDDKVLVSDRIEDVRVTFKGSSRRLRKIDQHEIERINLDLRHTTGDAIAISNDQIHLSSGVLPSGVAITSISPRYVRVAFDKRVEKVVEVVAPVVGRAEHGYVVVEVKPLSATVKLRGGERTLAQITQVRTREISLEGHTEPTFVEKADVVPPDGAEVVGNPQISVQIRLDEELVTRKLPGLLTVAIRGDADPARWSVTPAQVEVTLTGALLAVEQARTTLIPVVKATPDGKPREVEITVEGVPAGIGVKVSPEHARLVPAKPVSPSPPARTP